MAPTKGWDHTYAQDTACTCGHPYDRHFDSYEANAPVGCKYADRCGCAGFTAADGSKPRLVIVPGEALEWLQQYDAFELGRALGGAPGHQRYEWTARVTQYDPWMIGWCDAAPTLESAVEQAILDLHFQRQGHT
jgi:hypothetical protein